MLLIGRQMMPDQGELQHEDPGADHYVSIRSSNASARWQKLRVPFAGMHSTRDQDNPNLAFRLEAGRVIAYELDKEGAGVLVRVFVNAPFDRYVTRDARFWHASGVDVALDANGLKINTESLSSVLVGGLAFQIPEGAGAQPAADENAIFRLYPDRVQAMKQPITITVAAN